MLLRLKPPDHTSMTVQKLYVSIEYPMVISTQFKDNMRIVPKVDAAACIRAKL
jgi:hypothetical protein